MPILASDIMSQPPATVHPHQAVAGAAALLVERRICAVPVCASDGTLLGIISESDILQSSHDAALQGSDWSPSRPEEGGILPQEFLNFAQNDKRLIADVMTKNVVAAESDATLPQLAELMSVHGLKHIPIIREEKVIGMVSRADIVSAAARSASRVV